MLLYATLEVTSDLGGSSRLDIPGTEVMCEVEVRGRIQQVDGEWRVSDLEALDSLGRWVRADSVLTPAEVVDAGDVLVERGQPGLARVLPFPRAVAP